MDNLGLSAVASTIYGTGAAAAGSGSIMSALTILIKHKFHGSIRIFDEQGWQNRAP